MDWIAIVELGLAVFSPALMWMVWNMNASLKRTADTASAAKQNAWDVLQKLNTLEAEVARLREEHKEIQGNQERADEGLNKFADAVSSKVETIMRDHGEHEVGQAKIESKLDELIRRQK